MKNALIFALSCVAIAGSAHAGRIGAPVIAWSTGQDQAVCYVTNIDDKDEARIKSIVIIDGAGSIVDLDQDNCTDTELEPYGTCFALAFNINPRFPHGCVVDFKGSPDIRGVMEVRAGGVVQQNIPLY